jgi:hypothetical protein
MHRRPNFRRVKIHRNYTVEEISLLLDVHKNTVRNWAMNGLHPIDRRRPMLFLGRVLFDFLIGRRLRGRSRCGPGEIYCIRCRRPVKPAGNMADYLPLTAAYGNLRGICPNCELLIHRRVSRARLEDVRGELEVMIPQAQVRIGSRTASSVNCDFERDGAP